MGDLVAMARVLDTLGVGVGLTFELVDSGWAVADGVSMDVSDSTVDVHADSACVVGHDKVARVGSLTGGHAASDT